MVRRAPLFCLLVLVSACGNATAPLAERVDVRLEHVETSDEGGHMILFRVTNHGSGPVSLDRCGERIMTALERQTDGRWAPFSGDACPAVYTMVPYRLDPGAHVQSGRVAVHAGRFRLRVSVARGPSERGTRFARSDPFRLD